MHLCHIVFVYLCYYTYLWFIEDKELVFGNNRGGGTLWTISPQDRVSPSQTYMSPPTNMASRRKKRKKKRKMLKFHPGPIWKAEKKWKKLLKKVAGNSIWCHTIFRRFNFACRPNFEFEFFGEVDNEQPWGLGTNLCDGRNNREQMHLRPFLNFSWKLWNIFRRYLSHSFLFLLYSLLPPPGGPRCFVFWFWGLWSWGLIVLESSGGPRACWS